MGTDAAGGATGAGAAGGLSGSRAAVTAPGDVTNLEFIKTIFGRYGRKAMLVSFSKNPADATPRDWRARSAIQGVSHLSHNSNNFYCISTFKLDEHGEDRRRSDLFVMGHVVVLDDIGTKMIAAEALKLLGRPTYRLETSPGNEQWGYRLSTPCTDPGHFAALLHGLTKTSINPSGDDPGMKGVTRVVRLPVGRNTKAAYGPGGFKHRLLEWAPENTFTVEVMAAAAGIDLNAGVKAKGTFVSRPLQPGERDVWRGGLAALGMVKERRPDGTLDITCPFVDEHTGGEDSGAVRMPGGGFKCHHGHCSKRTKQDFHDRIKRRLRESGHGDLVARLDFENADKPAKDALWDCIARDEKPGVEHFDALACVPKAEMDQLLAAAGLIYGTDVKRIRAGLAKARSALRRKAIERQRKRLAKRHAGTPPPRGAPLAAPVTVTLEEMHLRTAAELQAVADEITERVARRARQAARQKGKAGKP